MTRINGAERYHRAGAGASVRKGYHMGNMMFTVGAMPSNDHKKLPSPSVWIGGTWLKDYGFEVGDKLELVRGKNMLVLVKVTDGVQAGAITSAVRLAV